jgi:hypothetical protein
MKINQPGAHLDHLLRQTRMNHLQLSSMADLKANMLLTMASVIASLTVPHLVKEQLKWPALILLGFCLMTIILAALSVIPRLPSTRNGDRPDPKSSGFNLLFFGDFAHLSYEEFEREIEDVLNDPNRTYEVQVRDVYLLGKFLAEKKYRLLRLAYLAFMGGLLLSAATLLFSGAIAF